MITVLSLFAPLRYGYDSILRAHPFRGALRIQHRAYRVFATLLIKKGTNLIPNM